MKSIVSFLLLLGLCTAQVLAFLPELFDYEADNYNWLGDYGNDDKTDKTPSSKPLEPQELFFNNAGDGSFLSGITTAVVQTKQAFWDVLQRVTQGVVDIFSSSSGASIPRTSTASSSPLASALTSPSSTTKGPLLRLLTSSSSSTTDSEDTTTTKEGHIHK